MKKETSKELARLQALRVKASKSRKTTYTKKIDEYFGYK